MTICSLCYICDQAWENQSCLHIKFDHFFEFQTLITLQVNIGALCNLRTLHSYAVFHKESDAAFRLLISQSETEILTTMLSGVFCVHKTGFPMLGHILSLATVAIIMQIN